MKTKKSFWNIFKYPDIDAIKRQDKVHKSQIISLIIYTGAMVVMVGIVRYFLQVIVVSNLGNKEVNNAIIQIASPATTMALLSGALVNTPLAVRYSVHRYDTDPKQRNEILVSGLVYALLMTSLFGFLYIGLITPSIFLQNPHISSTLRNQVTQYDYILFIALVFNALNTYLAASYASTGQYWMVTLYVVLSGAISLLTIGIVSSTHNSIGILAIPIGFAMFMVLFFCFNLTTFLIREWKCLNFNSFRNFNQHVSNYWNGGLVLLFTILAISVSGRYVFQIAASTTINAFSQLGPLNSSDVSFNNKPIDPSSVPGLNAIYWQSAFQYFYQIYLLGLLISFGIGQGVRNVLGIAVGTHKSSNILHVLRQGLILILSYYLLLSIILTAAGPYIAKRLGSSNNANITIHGQNYVLHHLLDNTRYIFFVCSPTLCFSALTYMLAIIAQVHNQPIISLLGTSIKNLVILILTPAFAFLAHYTGTFEYFYLAWPISDVCALIVCGTLIILYIKLVKISKKTNIKINYNNIVKYIRYHKTADA